MKRVIHTNGSPPSAKHQTQAIATEFFIFLSGFLATDYKTGLATEAAVAPNLPFCGPTAMTRQTEYNLYCMGNVLKAAGADFDDLIRIEQFMIGKDQAPWYSLARRAIMDRQHPTSTCVCAVGLEVPDALIVTDAIALNPAGGLFKEEPRLASGAKIHCRIPRRLLRRPVLFPSGDGRNRLGNRTRPRRTRRHQFLDSLSDQTSDRVYSPGNEKVPRRNGTVGKGCRSIFCISHRYGRSARTRLCLAIFFPRKSSRSRYFSLRRIRRCRNHR